MPISAEWGIRIDQDPRTGDYVASDARGVCPVCRRIVTFEILYQCFARIQGNNRNPWNVHRILECRSQSCSHISYVLLELSSLYGIDRNTDDFFIHPSLALEPKHPAVPVHISTDWAEAQKAFGVGAVKAAAVMCRRVLYGAILDKGCKEKPLHEG